MRLTFIFLFFSILLLTNCSNNHEELSDSIQAENQDTSVTGEVIDQENERIAIVEDSIQVKALATKIIHLLKDKKLTDIAQYINPEKGLQFSPDAYINEEQIKISGEEYINLIGSTKKYKFGIMNPEDGGDRECSFEEYYNEFIYNVDYANAPQMAYNQFLGAGNSLNNLKEFYPKAHFVEYYFSGFDKKYDGMDWQTLRLVFEKFDNQFYLVAIVHDQWSI